MNSSSWTRKGSVLKVCALAFGGSWSMALAAQPALPVDKLTLPPGFQIELVARVPNARAMAWGATIDGRATLYVGSMQEGKVHALTFPASGSKEPPIVRQIASGLRLPAGVAWKDGSLYVSSVNRIVRFDDIDRRLDHPPSPVVVSDKLPTDTHHGAKYIAFGPDGYLYVPVGAPCNICAPDENRYANIMRMKPDGSDLEVFAKGVRNTVGFAWDPQSRDLWFTDNGRDMLGDDLPPDELNRAPKAGMHFGYPYCHAGAISDPEFGKQRPCSEFEAPAQRLGPHVASLGMKFYTGTQFPERYRHQIFIAEHGSWNRSKKIGYRVTLVRQEGGKAVSYEPFVEGWLQPNDVVWGRPADIINAPDGSLLVSDDHAGAIYRIRYQPR